MTLQPFPRRSLPRGAILFLTIFFMVVFLGLVAFAVDMGYIVLARSQLQAAADSAALAAAGSMNLSPEQSNAIAIQFAASNTVGAKAVEVKNSDIEYGFWDTATRTFTPSASLCNAVKVTARADQTTSGEVPLFFGRVFHINSVSLQASAVATTNPRDICFVVDLSGSMNNDTDPDKTDAINSTFAPQGYPAIGTELMQKIYADFGFGAFPGVEQGFGQPLGVSSVSDLSSQTSSPLLNTRQPLTLSHGGTTYSYTVPTPYQISSTDSTSTAEHKAYSWVMDVQLRGISGFPPLPGCMPAAKPTPNSTDTNNYNYWYKYLSSYSTKIGYRSYMHFMLYYGRDLKPAGNSNLYTPLSLASPDCPTHFETTDGGTFSFPPREQPTHAARRATIAAIEIVKDRNQGVTQASRRDRVAMITFDLDSPPTPVHPLDDNYDAAMQACTQLQACSDTMACTATENGLLAAYNLLQAQGRPETNKVVVLLTDGLPNLKSSTDTEISNYRISHPSGNFYGGSSKYPQDAALMQASILRGKSWYLYPVGVGLGTDYDFMDRLARMSGTDQNGQSFRGSGNPAEYEEVLKTIFQNIITHPKLRLVQ